MREIGSEEHASRTKRNAVIIGLVMLGIMIASSAGYAFMQKLDNNPENDAENNGGIQQIGDYWVFDYNGQTMHLSNSPESVKNISVQISSQINVDKYSAKPLYIASANNGISYEIASNLGLFAPRAQLACYGNCTDKTQNLPAKDCYDNLIVWQESTTERVYQNDSCVFIEGDMKATDAFLYKVFGIN